MGYFIGIHALDMLQSRAGMVDFVEVGAVHIAFPLRNQGLLVKKGRGAVGVFQLPGADQNAVRPVKCELAQGEGVVRNDADIPGCSGRALGILAGFPLEQVGIVLLQDGNILKIFAVGGKLKVITAGMQAAIILYRADFRFFGKGNIGVTPALGKFTEALGRTVIAQPEKGHGGVDHCDAQRQKPVLPRHLICLGEGKNVRGALLTAGKRRAFKKGNPAGGNKKNIGYCRQWEKICQKGQAVASFTENQYIILLFTPYVHIRMDA